VINIFFGKKKEKKKTMSSFSNRTLEKEKKNICLCD